MPRYQSTEQIGVHAVGSIVTSQLEWIFREQPVVDMGIDAHIELVEDGDPTGKLIAVQIKTGASHFRETADGYVFYGTAAHLNYWTQHSLPVILIAHLPESGDTFWALVDEHSIEKTDKAWKLTIPKKNRLGPQSRSALRLAFEGSARDQRLRRLTIDEPLMRHIEAGHKVSVDLQDWYNKSLGRTEVLVVVHDKQGNETVAQEWFQYFIARDMKALAEMLFPWAGASMDHEFYEAHSDFEEDDRDRLVRAMDEDHGISPYSPGPADVFPYSDAAGEVASYRLQLTLNDLGRSYLVLSNYLDEESK